MAFVRASAVTVSFPLIDSTNRPARKGGLSFVPGDTRISKDGGAFTNTTNNPVEISSGRYKLDLTPTEMDGKLVHIFVTKAGADEYDERYETTNHRSGVVTADAGNTTTSFKTNLAESSSNYWKDSLVMFTSGALLNQVKRVGAYNGTSGVITLTAALSGIPSGDDRFILVCF